MKTEEITKTIQDKFGKDVIEVVLESPQPWVKVKALSLVAVAQYCRDHETLRFDFLRSIASVDYNEELELVYLLFSYSHRHEISLKVRVKRTDPFVHSVQAIWPAANWHEREAYDLMGFRFEGHPDLRRILLPDDWDGHPLRKDYKEKAVYGGVSTTREYPTGMPKLPTLPPVKG